jgi:hypothetical protein
LIGLVKVVHHWRPYVWGHSFIIRIDHFSLKYILDQRLTTIPQHTWVSKLFGYDFIVEYRQGKLNVVADSLSRCIEDSMATHSLSSPTFTLYDQLCHECASLPQAVQLRSQINDQTAAPGWPEVDGLLLFQGRILIPEDSSLWPAILEMAHTMGHEGSEKTLHRLRATFYSLQTRRRVREFMQNCVVCQQNKTEHLHPGGLLHPLPVPQQVWSDIVMDFIDGFPKVGGKSVILMVVDQFSKYAHFIPLSHPYSVSSVAKAFFDSIVHLHGMPCSIVSDREFTSHFWSELFQLTGVKLLLSSAFHPQTDGQSEVTNRIIAMYLCCLAGDRPRSWLQWLSWTEFCYNSSYQSTLQTTPFNVVYGSDPPPLIKYEAGSSRVAAVDAQL